jgi:hypothetical protein
MVCIVAYTYFKPPTKSKISGYHGNTTKRGIYKVVAIGAGIGAASLLRPYFPVGWQMPSGVLYGHCIILYLLFNDGQITKQQNLLSWACSRLLGRCRSTCTCLLFRLSRKAFTVRSPPPPFCFPVSLWASPADSYYTGHCWNDMGGKPPVL